MPPPPAMPQTVLTPTFEQERAPSALAVLVEKRRAKALTLPPDIAVYELGQTPSVLLRFLRATKFDPAKADALLDRYWAARSDLGLPRVRSFSSLLIPAEEESNSNAFSSMRASMRFEVAMAMRTATTLEALESTLLPHISAHERAIVDVLRTGAIRLPVRECGNVLQHADDNAELSPLAIIMDAKRRLLSHLLYMPCGGEDDVMVASRLPSLLFDPAKTYAPLRDADGRRFLLLRPALMDATAHPTNALIDAFHVIVDAVLEERDAHDEGEAEANADAKLWWTEVMSNHLQSAHTDIHIAANHASQRAGVTIVSHQGGCTMRHYMSSRASMRAIMRSLSSSMPLRVGALVIVDAPAAFRVAWNMLCAIPGAVSAKMKARLRLVSPAAQTQ